MKKINGMKNGRSLAEDLGLIRRGLREFDRILPRQLAYVAGKSVLGVFCPYVAVIAMAGILGELTGGRSREKLLLYAGLSVLLTFFLTILKNILEARISVGYSDLFAAHEIHLTDKAYDLPYEMLESEEVRSLRDQVSGSISVSGAGMASLYWDMEAICSGLSTALTALLLCICYGARLSGGLLAGILVFAFGCAWISCRMTSRRWDVSYRVFEQGAAYQRYGDYYTMNYLPDENLGMDTRIFRQKQLVLEESRKRCYEPFARGKRKEMRADSLYGSVKLLCTGLCGLAVYGLTAAQTLQGRVPIGEILVLYSAVTSLIFSLSNIAETFTDLRNNNIHLIHYFAYMDLPAEKPDQAQQNGYGQMPLPMTAGELRQTAKSVQEIRFEHVSFSYPGSEEEVLRDISLTIHGGEKLAIVGVNGSGKTTLIKLLCRLYRPTRGRILLNGRDIQAYPQEDYWQLLSTVFQDFALFAFSLGANVAAAHGYDRQRAETALRRAGLGEKLAGLPRGLDQALFTDYEPDGTELSGGEAQKAAIARALYKNGPVLILDEPTAALDPYAEAAIYEMLFQRQEPVQQGRILISISHRLSTCRFCDRIAVLQQGRLVQVGTHRQLVGEESGAYRQLWQAQAEYYT
ncbi:MAG: ABC transporter ATP-binding protein [Lachnospiraceae bacterium]|nr:ABC transporter ATP-binding protein [Lachnospiraceae bacterium]